MEIREKIIRETEIGKLILAMGNFTGNEIEDEIGFGFEDDIMIPAFLNDIDMLVKESGSILMSISRLLSYRQNTGISTDPKIFVGKERLDAIVYIDLFEKGDVKKAIENSREHLKVVGEVLGESASFDKELNSAMEILKNNYKYIKPALKELDKYGDK